MVPITPRVHGKLRGAGRRRKYDSEQLTAAVRDVRTPLVHRIGRLTNTEDHIVEVNSLRYKRGSKQDFFEYSQIPDVVNVRVEDNMLKSNPMIPDFVSRGYLA